MRSTKQRTAKRRTRGSALPAVLALSVGVGALAAAFVSQNLREHNREKWERDRAQAYFDAWAQMEVVSDIVNNSPYDAGTGENMALRAAATRGDRTFVDRDGYLTGVTAEVDGGAGTTGYYRLVSTRQVGDSRCRVTALVRSRQSFADFDYFVNSHDLGISGGVDASSRHADAPDGDIHSNRRLLFYFPDRHFKKPVTATTGFSFVSGAIGPADASGNPQNNWFWGPSNPSAAQIVGLTTIDIPAIGTRADTLLNLNGPWDWAKVKMKGGTTRVEHWQVGHNEIQDVTTWVEQFHYETRTRELLNRIATTTTSTVPVYTPQTVSVFGPVAYTRLISAAWDETVTRTRSEARQRWIEGGGGGATGGGGGSGDVGYWETYYVTVTYDEIVSHPAVYETYYVNEWHNVVQNVQTGTTTQTNTTYSYVSFVPPQYEDYQVKITDGWTQVTTAQTVWEAQHREATHDVASNGTIYVTGKIEISPMTTGSDGFAVQTLDGSLTLATNSDVQIRDSIVYAHRDGAGTWQTAYLNGSDRTQEFVPNTNYTGSSVLGIVARNDIEILTDVPDQTELDGTFMARDGEFRVKGVNVATNGTVSTSSSGAYVKMSLRRLGGIVSNQRPVTTFVDSNNTVTRGFVFTKSIYDVRQRTNPPRGFPTLNRPKVMATLIREIN